MTVPAQNREKPCVLIIDDEPQIRHFLRISLKTEGYELLEAENGETGLGLCARHSPELVILDLGLPDMDGSEVLAGLREWSSAPVIILSVRDRELEKVKALDLGANDYVTKPFGVDELLARVRTQLRSQQQQNASTPEAPVVFDDGTLYIDLSLRKIVVNDTPIKLTPKEFAVLKAIMLADGKIVTQSQLLKDIWGPTHTKDTHYLRILIGRLRQKLGDDPTEQHYIQTEPSVGYRFTGNDDKAGN
ncbi:two-component system, OmpR family, KDP operon response regulator KdpE [Marinobacter persicus]|uniref:Two-component system, OmpR family, KDP operon response regulator KdpE n=1 Tax=Marinobacter persicus TaxID=930118 RepID=A0A1I3QKF3_9GAMM|nr:response regulator [Marinobacter persicus]GHD42490.1 DNA-binding response regulator [Marinobacter persicus]SFJ34032.1 two-component system, OmpR family, KDP operon response regulator KdpE [Marinobacter persicus]